MPFTVNPMPPQVSAEKLDKLRQCETATIGHFEHETFMDPELRPVIPGIRVVGTAVTLRLPSMDSSLTSYAISKARPGDFFVIDRCGDRKHATWGNVVSMAAQKAGIVGAAVDGPTTDPEDQRNLGMPCWCRGISPITCKRIGLSGSMNVPVTVGGVAVNPGDAILADECGVFVCPPDRLDEIADEALRRQEKEKATISRLEAGETFGEISGMTKVIEDALRKAGKPLPM